MQEHSNALTHYIQVLFQLRPVIQTNEAVVNLVTSETSDLDYLAPTRLRKRDQWYTALSCLPPMWYGYYFCGVQCDYAVKQLPIAAGI